MASELVTLDDVKQHLLISTSDTTYDGVLGALLVSVKAMFETACGRDERPFQDAQAGRTEVKDGTGTDRLWLDYAPTAITSIKLGTDVANKPDEILDPADLNRVTWGASGGLMSRRLARVDSGIWGHPTWLRYVTVVYDAAADLPAAAKIGVTAGVAVIFRRLGSEDLRSERVGAYSAEYVSGMEQDPLWKWALSVCREPRT